MKGTTANKTSTAKSGLTPASFSFQAATVRADVIISGLGFNFKKTFSTSMCQGMPGNDHQNCRTTPFACTLADPIHIKKQYDKNNYTFTCDPFFTVACFGQTFEGKIDYKNVYKSKIPNVTDDQFTTMMGSTQEYFIKDGDYKSVANGSFFQWQLYLNKDNKLYNKMANAETLFWNDATTNPDQVLKAALNKGVTEVLGYKCDELILTCNSGKQKYYFNTRLSVDSKLFSNHKLGNWHDFLSRSNSLPLKSIIDNAQFTLESEATEVKAMELDKTLFQLPAGSKTAKSPY